MLLGLPGAVHCGSLYSVKGMLADSVAEKSRSSRQKFPQPELYAG